MIQNRSLKGEASDKTLPKCVPLELHSAIGIVGARVLPANANKKTHLPTFMHLPNSCVEGISGSQRWLIGNMIDCH